MLSVMKFEWPSASISSYSKKLKLNLLSAPLKLVSQDSERSLPSITSAGTKGRLPKGTRIKAICILTQAIKAQQSRSGTMTVSLYHNCRPNEMQNATERQLQFSSRGGEEKKKKRTKSKVLITMLQRPAVFLPRHIRRNISLLNIKHLFPHCL